MGRTIAIHRGYDIRLKGAADKSITELAISDIVAIKPPDFRNVKPKLQVAPGETVLAGQCLFTDKNRPELRFTSPVSGEIAEIFLGAKRRILEIRILADKSETRYQPFDKKDPTQTSKDSLIQQLLDSGCWNYIRQRPYDIIAHPTDTPKAIFVSLFDTAPLAPDIAFVLGGSKSHFQTGLQVLRQLADGNLHLGIPAGNETMYAGLIQGVDTTHVHTFRGPHPSGNVGIQIHHISPLRKDERVWYVHPQDVVIIGRLFQEGRYQPERIIALTGSAATRPRYIKTVTGQSLASITGMTNETPHHRLIQGNVLHGATSAESDYLSFYTNQITIIPEGDQPEFLGWMLPGFKKLSLSRTFFSWLAPRRTYVLDTNLHGEERAFVMTGQYDKVLPMNIMPVFLLKAILAKDIEKMEQLGIFEVAEEDLALCEFVCTSKIKVQQIVREGLDMMMAEEV